MALDVLQKRLLNGKSRPEVLELLGPLHTGRDFEFVYDVGQCSGFGWEHSQLLVRFGQDGKVRDAHFSRVDWEMR